MKKWILIISASLLALILLLSSALFFLLGTESGTRFLVAMAEKQLAGALKIESSRGTLLDRVELNGLLYDGDGGRAELGHLVLDWESSALLHRHFHILELSVSDISYTSPPPSPEPEVKDDSPFTLPQLKLPVTITIDRLSIDNFTFLSAADAEPVTVHQANLILNWDKNGIDLQEMKVAVDEASLEARGRLNPVGNYPLQLSTAMQTTGSELPSLTMLGEYGGDLKELEITEELRGDITAELRGTVKELVDAPAWQAELTIKELAPALFSPDLPGVLQGSLETHGNLQELSATADLSIRDKEAAEYNWDADLDLQANLETMEVSIRELQLKHLDTPSFIRMSGSADTDGPLDLKLSWQDLQYPLTGAGDYQSSRGEATLTGKVDDYQVQLQADLGGEMLPATQLDLGTDGNLKQIENLVLNASLLGGDIHLQAGVQWDPAISWELESRAQELTPALHYAEMPGTLNWRLQSSGTMEDAKLTADIELRDEKSAEVNWDGDLDILANIKAKLFTINHLKLTQLDGPAYLELAGSADAEGPLDLTLQWQELQWPLSGDADYGSARGDVTIKGTTDQYHLSLASEVAGAMIPPATLRLDSDGNLESVDNLKLSASLLEGNVNVQGKLQWAPVLSWEVSTDGAHINPGLQYEEWPGKLGWQLESTGSLAEEGTIAEVKLNHLGGSLRHLEIGGQGEVHVRPEHIEIKDFQLSSGPSLISAQGILDNDQSNLSWKVDIPEFSDLLPDGRGKLYGEGTVKGRMTSPQLTLNLGASSLHLPQLDLKELKGEADIDLSWEKPFHLDLSAGDLQSGETLVERIILQGDGSIEEHTAQLQAKHELAEITIGLNGGYLEEQWQGLLSTLSLKAEKLGLGEWQLENPATLVAGVKNANLETMCLHREKTAVCLEGSWDNDNLDTGGKVEIREFPLNWLSQWFPESLTDVGGLLSLNADARMGEKLEAEATAQISPGAISYITERQKGEFPHEGMKMNLKAAGDALDADLSLSIDSNTIDVAFNSPDILRKNVGSNAQIDARVQVDAKKFDMVQTLIPEVQELDAAVSLDLQASGKLEQPDLTGKGTIAVPHVLIPAAGLDLNDTVLDIKTSNRQLLVKGIFHSPEGSMTLTGDALIDKEQNWPLHLTLKGDNFKLINRPKIQVFITPDLTLGRTDALTNLTGSLTIPKAEILLQQLPPGSESVSPDVVILQEEKEEEPTAPLSMNLTVTLGNNVHFSGLGLDAFIEGQIVLTAKPGEQMLGSGTFHIKEGNFRAYGQELEIQTGVISFPGGPLTQPGINLRATRTIDNIVVGISALGPALKPRITTFSHPPMSESQIISYLLTGSAPSDPSTGAKVSIGRQINKKLSVSVGTDVKTGDREFIARYRLNRKLHVQTTTATQSNAVDIFYTVEPGKKEEEEVEKEEQP